MSNDINDYYYEEHFRESRNTTPETHYDRRCRYIRRENCEVYDDEEDVTIYDVLILIRLCLCGSYTNKARFTKYRMQFELSEIEDGHEVHFHTECRYSQKRGTSWTLYYKELTKHEYCSTLSLRKFFLYLIVYKIWTISRCKRFSTIQDNSIQIIGFICLSMSIFQQ